MKFFCILWPESASDGNKMAVHKFSHLIAGCILRSAKCGISGCGVPSFCVTPLPKVGDYLLLYEMFNDNVVRHKTLHTVFTSGLSVGVMEW